MPKTRSEKLWKIALPLKEHWLDCIDYSVMMNYLHARNNWELSIKANMQGFRERIGNFYQFKRAQNEAISEFCGLVTKQDILVFGTAVKPRASKQAQNINPQYVNLRSVNFKRNEIRLGNRLFRNVRIMHKREIAGDINGQLSGPISKEIEAFAIIAICEKEIPNFWELQAQQRCQEIHKLYQDKYLKPLKVGDATIRRYLRNYKAKKIK